MKRYRAPKMKPGQLRMYWGRVDGDSPDVCYMWGGGGANKCDAALLHYHLGTKQLNWKKEIEPSLIEELEKRGYDISTLKFSIEMKRPAPQEIHE
jgi:hypothetical protein